MVTINIELLENRDLVGYVSDNPILIACDIIYY